MHVYDSKYILNLFRLDLSKLYLTLPYHLHLDIIRWKKSWELYLLLNCFCGQGMFTCLLFYTWQIKLCVPYKLKYLFLKFFRFHGSIIKSLKNRQADVVELHIPLTSNVSHIQTCLIDIMNYTVKQLKSINRTLDLQVKLLLMYFSFKCECLWVWMFRCPFLFHANITERS